MVLIAVYDSTIVYSFSNGPQDIHKNNFAQILTDFHNNVMYKAG